MNRSLGRGFNGPQLYAVGLGCFVLTVALFVASFGLGNSLGPQGAVLVLVTGVVISVVFSLITVVLAMAGLVAFPVLRVRFVILLVLSLLFSPLLWLTGIALLL